jgi:hypothetical protein
VFIKYFLPKIVPFMRKCGKIWYGTSRNVTSEVVETMRFECRITTARKLAPTRNRYVILTTFLRQQWLCRRVSVLRTLIVFCLRHCAASRKFAGSIPDWVIRIFHWLNASGRIVPLASTQHLTGMSTTSISWRRRWPVRRADKCLTLRPV